MKTLFACLLVLAAIPMAFAESEFVNNKVVYGKGLGSAFAKDCEIPHVGHYADKQMNCLMDSYITPENFVKSDSITVFATPDLAAPHCGFGDMILASYHLDGSHWVQDGYVCAGIQPRMTGRN